MDSNNVTAERELSASDFPFVKNESCAVSDIFYQRAIGNGVDVAGMLELNTSADRVKFVNLIRKEGKTFCEELGVKFLDTNGVHDVTNGMTPFGDFFFCDMIASLHDFEGGEYVSLSRSLR